MFSPKAILAVAVAIQAVMAAPTSNDGEVSITKRGEGIHLINCRPWGAAGNENGGFSVVAVSHQDNHGHGLIRMPNSI